MKPRRRWLVLAGAIALGVWWYERTPEPTVLSFNMGETIEDVARNSSYPVLEHSNRPDDDPDSFHYSDTYVTEPAVIIRFTDPKHGFTLPPTKFAALTYANYRADVLTTSPMLESLPFDDAVAVLENLQDQFKAGGWEPWAGDDSTWFDLSPDGRKRLYATMFEPGYMQSTELRVPGKYAMVFRLWCTEGCATREPPYLFLIDVDIGHDVHTWWDKDHPSASQAKPPASPRSPK